MQQKVSIFPLQDLLPKRDIINDNLINNLKMLSILKKIFSPGAKTDYKDLVQNGAVIIDVRTKEEYQGGHIKGSTNIPLNMLAQNLSKIKKDKCVITCCASGMRSASAKGILKSNGFAEVYNGGGWIGLQKKIS